jgi:hypothetical protein
VIEILQKKVLQPFLPLSFDEAKHIYYWYGHRINKSVSAKVEEHVDKFNADKVIGRNGETLIQLSARKQSRIQGKEITEHELRHTWQTAAKDGCEIGTETHDYLEYYNGTKIANTPQKKAGVKFLRHILTETFINDKGVEERRYEIIARELRMYSVRWKFAGTADLILADKKFRTIVIVDYKTNKDLFKTFKSLKSPFDYLECNPFNKYQLQLSYYHIIFEEMVGLKVSNRILAHLKADETFQEFSLYDFSEDLRLYLHRTSKN